MVQKIQMGKNTFVSWWLVLICALIVIAIFVVLVVMATKPKVKANLTTYTLYIVFATIFGLECF